MRPLKSIQMLHACGCHSRRCLCPANRLARLLGRRYVISVLSLLTNVGTRRFVDLRTHLKGVSTSTLAAILRDLSKMGIVTRTVSRERLPRVVYTLSDEGQRLARLLQKLRPKAL